MQEALPVLCVGQPWAVCCPGAMSQGAAGWAGAIPQAGDIPQAGAAGLGGSHGGEGLLRRHPLPRGSPSRVFCTPFSPQPMPFLPAEL